MIIFEHTKHKALWDAIIALLHDNAQEYVFSATELKEKAFAKLYPRCDEPLYTCYACEYDENVNDMFTEENRPEDCANCPLLWPDNKTCSDNDSLYDHFTWACRCGNLSEAIEFATRIRDLPVKEGIDVE